MLFSEHIPTLQYGVFIVSGVKQKSLFDDGWGDKAPFRFFIGYRPPKAPAVLDTNWFPLAVFARAAIIALTVIWEEW